MKRLGAEQNSELVTRAKTGDGGAFGELLGPVLDPAFRVAMTMLRDRTAAEDAVQEASLKAWRKLGGFRPHAELRPWFLAIVANECRTLRRRQWWRVLRVGDPRAFEGEVSQTRALGDRLDLDAALDQLPRHHLLPLVLYYHLDLPIEEVARTLGCAEGAARQRVHRALEALRPKMQMEVGRGA